MSLAVATPVLRFDAAEHRYYVGGEEYPSVTHVLESERLLDFGGASRDAMEHGRAIGQAVHDATELDDIGDLDESVLDPQLAGYVTAWRRFRAETGFMPERIEARVYHPRLRYAGTLDRTGRARRWSGLVDLKSGSPQRATGYQTAAYLECLPATERRLLKRFGCYLREDGTYALVPYADPTDFAVFCAALTLHNARKRT